MDFTDQKASVYGKYKTRYLILMSYWRKSCYYYAIEHCHIILRSLILIITSKFILFN